MAHLSIERALKFLIRQQGLSFTEDHHLHRHLETLRQSESDCVNLLDLAFNDAVKFYGLNPNRPHQSHLKSLHRYLCTVGNAKAFQKIRYWELDQVPDEELIRQISLPIHLEILHALYELLLSRGKRTPRTVVDRTEHTAREALLHTESLAYVEGSDEEKSVKAYIAWLTSHQTYREALAEAVRSGFSIGDQYMNQVVTRAYNALTQSNDPAIQYLAQRLDVLPKQPRDATPLVEWIDHQQECHGVVTTPSGHPLGFIDKSADGIWHITPSRSGLVRVSARTETQTDARRYLAQLLTTPATITTGTEPQHTRLVGEQFDLFQRNYEDHQLQNDASANPVQWSHKITIWDQDQNIRPQQPIKVEVSFGDTHGVIDVLEGTVSHIAGDEIYIIGSESVRMATDQD